MRNLINRVQLIGNLGMDVETKELDNGGKLAKVALATNHYYSKDGEKLQQTDWHNLIAWGSTAKMFSDMCSKGSRVAVQGKLTTRSWENPAGQKQYRTEVVVDEFYIMDQRKDASPF